MAAQSRKSNQVTREMLTDEEWHHLDTVVFPLLRDARIKAREILAAREKARTA